MAPKTLLFTGIALAYLSVCVDAQQAPTINTDSGTIAGAVNMLGKSKYDRQFTSTQWNEYKRQFSMFDLDRNGFIVPEEAAAVVERMLGVAAQEDIDLASMLHKFDADNDGEVSFDEFVTARPPVIPKVAASELNEPAPAPLTSYSTAPVAGSTRTVRPVVTAYRAADLDQNNWLSVAEFRTFMVKRGQVLNFLAARRLFGSYDVDGNNRLSLWEFKLLWAALKFESMLETAVKAPAANLLSLTR